MTIFEGIFWGFYLLLGVRCSVRIIRTNHPPTVALGWLLAVWLMPLVGVLLYYLTAWRRTIPSQRIPEGESNMERIISRGCGTRQTQRNEVRLLNNGGEMFAALIAELQRAKRSIHLEYYIFDDDRIGGAVAEVLIRRARSGVQVRLIYDLVGSWLPAWGLLRRLRQAGVEVQYFRPLRFPWITPALNERNHRKIAVVDGRVAFLGGINIARRYLDGNALGKWRDEHIRIEGEAVRDLQSLFAADWQAIGGAPFSVEQTLQPVAVRGEMRCQIAWSQSGATRPVLEDAITALFMQARREILITTPYFIPTEPLLRSLCVAAMGGVRVRLMIPARADLAVVAAASESYLGEFLAAGGEVLRYEDGFLHAKMIVVDRAITYVGTANMDYRSLRTNWEVAAFLQDRAFAEAAVTLFETDCQHCTPWTREQEASRTGLRQVAVRLARLLSPLL